MIYPRVAEISEKGRLPIVGRTDRMFVSEALFTEVKAHRNLAVSSGLKEMTLNDEGDLLTLG